MVFDTARYPPNQKANMITNEDYRGIQSCYIDFPNYPWDFGTPFAPTKWPNSIPYIPIERSNNMHTVTSYIASDGVGAIKADEFGFTLNLAGIAKDRLEVTIKKDKLHVKVKFSTESFTVGLNSIDVHITYEHGLLKGRYTRVTDEEIKVEI